MPDVYVVTDDSDGDWIVGIFSRRDEAERVAGSQGVVTAYLVDPPIPDEYRQGLQPWAVHLSKDGECVHVYSLTPTLEAMRPPQYFYFLRIGDPHSLVRACDVWATDRAHAIAVANEQRVQVLAAGTWGHA